MLVTTINKILKKMHFLEENGEVFKYVKIRGVAQTMCFGCRHHMQIQDCAAPSVTFKFDFFRKGTTKLKLCQYLHCCNHY